MRPCRGGCIPDLGRQREALFRSDVRGRRPSRRDACYRRRRHLQKAGCVSSSRGDSHDFIDWNAGGIVGAGQLRRVRIEFGEFRKANPADARGLRCSGTL